MAMSPTYIICSSKAFCVALDRSIAYGDNGKKVKASKEENGGFQGCNMHFTSALIYGT